MLDFQDSCCPLFLSPLDQVREITAEWLQSYNEERPHDALAGLPPATYRPILKPEVLHWKCRLDGGAYGKVEGQEVYYRGLIV